MRTQFLIPILIAAATCGCQTPEQKFTLPDARIWGEKELWMEEFVDVFLTDPNGYWSDWGRKGEWRLVPVTDDAREFVARLDFPIIFNDWKFVDDPDARGMLLRMNIDVNPSDSFFSSKEWPSDVIIQFRLTQDDRRLVHNLWYIKRPKDGWGLSSIIACGPS